MQLGGSSVSEISSPSKPEMAVTAAAAVPGPGPQEEAAREGVNGGHEVVGMEVDANSSGEEKGRELGEEGGGGDDHEGDKISFGGNRWPRQETLALLKIRSDMDAVFRDSSLKGPLWEEVSRKLAELGYHRSAKKCKEKFENVYKYHKRTKEGRSGKSEGKTYKFFDQLQALENQFTVSYQPKSPPVLATTTTTTNTVTFPLTRPSDGTTISHAATTFPSTNTIISPSPPPPPTNNATTTTTTTTTVTNTRNPPSQPNNISVVPHSLPNNNNNSNMNLIFSSSPTSTSSSTASDEGLEERYRKKRKWKEYFRRLTRQVLAKQGDMQKRFLEAIDKRERERVAQEDAWRMQELARINKEHEILVQERSNAAAKDAAVIALLHKLSGQQNPPQPAAPPPLPPPLPPQVVASQQQQQKAQQELSQPQPQPPLMPNNNFEIQGIMSNGHSGVVTTTPMSSSATSSSRWPKAEVHALIRLRTSLEAKYQENGPKAPLWEDISAGMQRLGYNRNAKRCKEKWENINKYFKKVKESNKQRREDSKTCPYFNELDAIYKERSNNQNPLGNVMPSEMMMEPLMVQPEQQWRPPPQYHHEQQPLQDGVANENATSQSQEKEAQAQAEEAELEEEEEEDDEYVDDEDGDTSVEHESASRYEIVTNKLSSVDTVE